MKVELKYPCIVIITVRSEKGLKWKILEIRTLTCVKTYVLFAIISKLHSLFYLLKLILYTTIFCKETKINFIFFYFQNNSLLMTWTAMEIISSQNIQLPY